MSFLRFCAVEQLQARTLRRILPDRARPGWKGMNEEESGLVAYGGAALVYAFAHVRDGAGHRR